ncbi:MAG TPA: ribonuclease P protein component [Candidatus Limnocylindrales bacterium]|nr:ribonuclease P protein component [Candidatus Limnocylindrales bacterium]
MLQKVHRLPAKQKFRNSSFFKTPDFTIRISPNDLPVSRFGFVVRKALDKRAVVRNRTRRVFRSCIEEMINEIKLGYDMLFVLEKGIIEKKREIIFKDLHKLLTEKKLLT